MTISKLFLPPPVLSGCLFGAIYRDTRGASLTDEERFNHFPASPLISLTVILRGVVQLVSTAGPLENCSQQMPPVSVIGPQDGPISSWSEGPVTVLTLGIYPDAWARLGGDTDYTFVASKISECLDRFGQQEDAEQGWVDLCMALALLWETVRPMGWEGAHGIADWARLVITRAALSGAGRSLRSVERRIKRLSGQTRRTLDFFTAFEALHQISRNADGAELADIALQAGYSDQSHMGRAVRRATGFSPARLNRAIKCEEAFWCYRLLGERY